MNRRTLVIILAVTLAVLGTTAVLVYVSKADARALAGQQAVTVLVATEPIPAGTSVAAAKSAFAVEQMPAASVPSDVLDEISQESADLVTSADIAQGQLLTARLLVKKSEKTGIVLPKGKLAVSIPVEGGEQSGGQLKSGFKVALFNTFTVAEGKPSYTPSGEELTFGEDKDQATRLLLPEVEVIGVMSDSEESGDAFGKFLVTVAVSQREAEKLIHALATGVVSIAQINDDSQVAPSKGIDTFHLFEQNGN